MSIKNSEAEGLAYQGLRGVPMSNRKSAKGIIETAVREFNSRISKRFFTLSLISFQLRKRKQNLEMAPDSGTQ